MESCNFFSMMARMKYINRWGLMRNSRNESLSEHSMDVAMYAHALGCIGKRYFSKDINCERLCLLALYHDAPEIITGDLPTPVKYYNQDIKRAYKQVEKEAAGQLLRLLPEELRLEFKSFFIPAEKDTELWKFIKAADKLAAYIKCIEEEKFGNMEFISAKQANEQALQQLNMPEVQFFMEHFLSGFSLTLDELKNVE